jgi:hypothetical protein
MVLPARFRSGQRHDDQTGKVGRDKIAGLAWDGLDVGVGGMAAQVPEVQGN